MCEWVRCSNEAANHQLLIAVAVFMYCTSESRKNIEVVLLINCLAWRGVLMRDNIFPMRKHSKCGLDLAAPLLHLLRLCRLGDFHWDTGPLFLNHSSRPTIHRQL